MVDLSKVERFAELKSIIKGLEAEAKMLQEEIIADGAPDKLKTLHGTLTLTKRETFECPDNQAMLDNMGLEAYLKVSSVSAGAVKKEYGETRFEMLKALDLMKLKSVSVYYTLRR